ncbi:hypothetical protein G6F57_013553 [Rhizopus arrhizus]|uniref:Uncharacterized protein n=1 Tax=Rhizopus oryzae TaxID=64495 RepID=A0A9P6X2T0_RHIOR|nr:hypothetical protein G6F22_013376 [Rhizopus arrhizus]KAG1394656.1 hypothetical protein G6F58_012090 [Rhizopus delemar]KAG0777583.1 hypothetical protein G6F21_013302 [Rhizopus arrhizus]KAG0804901.1 hypothetical protein G6F20_012334 [Rhizopus arrhizus]KAG0824869.1 hypothetical protein G6F19_010112 [Rhizopus arrhizus]
MDNRYPYTNSRDQPHPAPTSPDKTHWQPTQPFTPAMLHPPPFPYGHRTYFPHGPHPDVSYPHHTRQVSYEPCWTQPRIRMPSPNTPFWDDREQREDEKRRTVEPSKRGRDSPEDDDREVKKRATDVEVIEDQLSYLTDDWQIISIVLNSVRNAYLTGKTSSRENMPLETIMDIVRESEGDQEQLYSEILKEIKIAFDELGIQVKQLARKIDMLEEEKNKLISKRRSIGRIKSSQEASVNSPSQEPGQLGSSRSSKTRRPIKTSGQSMTSRKGKEKAM